MRSTLVVAAALATALTACSGGAPSVPAAGNVTALRPGPSKPVCGEAAPGFERCFAWIRTDIHGKKPGSTPSGYGPSDLQTAYGLRNYSQNNGAGETVAIVDAYHDPDAANDLAVYRQQYGLPECGTTNKCFKQVAMTKTENSQWGVEESLDIEMVSAICPNCKIMLVEAASSRARSLAVAEKYATQHADYVSNSWGGHEGKENKKWDADFNAKGVAVVAAAGDSGYNPVANWPAILPTVTGVGGTSLTSTSPRVESAWSGAGSGCSKMYKTPSFQQGIDTGCSKRAEDDTAAVADPNTGVAIYDTFDGGGWGVIGGTSVASPIIASVFALAGNTSSNTPATLYSNPTQLNDITSGSNGDCGAPLCQAGIGWDGPTGLGTPNGIGAF
jgi:subtilase family serine protease